MKFMVHHPEYRPAGKVRQNSQYHAFARFYPFYPPVFEQKAWLEKRYQESPEV